MSETVELLTFLCELYGELNQVDAGVTQSDQDKKLKEHVFNAVIRKLDKIE